MSWDKVKVSSFLTPREERFKPNAKEIIGLKRIEKINFSGEIIISEKPSKTDMILIKKNDLVISGINVAKGAVAVYEDEEDITATIHYSSYTYNQEVIDIKFLKIFLKSPEFLEAIKEQVPGGIKTEIKPKHLLPLEVVIPNDVIEQRAIVKKYLSKELKKNKLLKEIEKQQTYITKLRQAFLTEAMQGKLVPQDPNDEPASELLKKIKAEKEKLIKEGKIKKQKPLPPIKPEEIPYEIPENWVWVKLGEICETNGRIGWKGLSASEYKNEGPLFLSVYSLNHGDYVDYSKVFHISQDRYNESPEIMLRNDDILICKDGAGIGKLGIIKDLHEQATVNSSLLLIRKYLNLDSKYIYYFLLSSHFQKIVISRIMGATTPHLYQRDIVNFSFALPPLRGQKRIVEKLDNLMQKCDELEANINTTKEQTEQLIEVLLKEALNPQE